MLSLLFAASLSLHHVVKAEQPFESAAVSWTADSAAAVRVRVSEDGRTWSDWMPVAIDDDSTDVSSGHSLAAIAHFGSAKRYIEYAFDGAVDRVSVVMFPPSVGTGFSPTGRLKPAATLTVRSRTDWGCPDGENSPLWAPQHTVV